MDQSEHHLDNNQEQMESINFNLTISSFQINIINNFKYIHRTLESQKLEIYQLKSQVSHLQPKNIAYPSTNMQQTKILTPTIDSLHDHNDQKIPTSAEVRQIIKEESIQKVYVEGYSQVYQENHENLQEKHVDNLLITSKIEIQDKNQEQNNEQQLKIVDNITEVKRNQSKNDKKQLPKDHQKTQEHKPLKSGQQQLKKSNNKIVEHIQNPLLSTKNISFDLMQQKMSQLFQRIRTLQQKQTTNMRTNMKQFRQIQHEIQNSNKHIQKNVKTRQQFQQTIQKLRNELSEFKLKKQAKLMKLINTKNLSQSTMGNSDNLDYITQKIQFLLKHVRQLVNKKTFEEERDSIHLDLQNLRRKVNENISNDFFDDSIKSFQERIYQNIAKYIKSLQLKRPEQGKNQEEESMEVSNIDKIIQQGNQEFKIKVNAHEQKLKGLKQQMQYLKSGIEVNRKERLQFQDESLEQNKHIQDNAEELLKKIQDIEKHIQNIQIENTQKHLQSEKQIIEIQQNLQRVNSHIKSYNYTSKEGFNQTPVSPSFSNYEQIPASERKNNPELQNQLKTQQRKYNKLMAKVQGLKEDLLSIRADFINETQLLKINLERKADDQSFKKIVSFFDEKIKENKGLVQSIYDVLGKGDSGESSVMKKGWTCLVCDKDIKNSDPLSSDQLRLLNINSSRQIVPKVGSFHRQMQQSLQYKQIYMKDHMNYRGKRLTSLKSNQSRQQLN